MRKKPRLVRIDAFTEKLFHQIDVPAVTSGRQARSQERRSSAYIPCTIFVHGLGHVSMAQAKWVMDAMPEGPHSIVTSSCSQHFLDNWL
jgi:hypothetical protein